MPWSLLNEKSDQDSAKVVTDSLAYALSEAIERLNYKNTNDDEPLRKVVTYPVQQIHSMDSTYSQSFEIILSTPTITLLPDPVAAIWGAQTRNLLPTDQDTPHTFLVIDVGGSTTQVSVVQKDIARGYLSVPWGGETFIRLLIDYLLQEGQPNGGSNNQRVTDARSLSAIQLQARAAVAELSNKMRVGVHVPYLFADPKHHHLDTTVSRTVLEHAVNNHIQHELVASIQDSAVLSPHLPVPTNVNSLFTSLLTQTLEYANKMPSDIHNVLLIGGASKAPMVQAAMNHALLAVMGPQGPAKLASMDQVLSTELTVLGAATMLPYWTYSVEHGLKVEG
jgi:molecular chaperone DnaK (HSP70)